MRVLLDSNVWRYISDSNAGPDLLKLSRQRNIDVLVAPAIATECSAIGDSRVRSKVLNLVCNPLWKRLMPDVFLECQEIKAEVHRLRREWLLPKPNLNEIRKLRYDWMRKEGGFWSRVREQGAPINPWVEAESKRVKALARDEAYQIRNRVAKLDQSGESTPLMHVFGLPPNPTPGWNSEPVEYWRIPSLFHASQELSQFTSPYCEWLDAEVNIKLAFSDPASFNRFWLYDVRPAALPRFWIRGAFEFLQSWHKVTNGTPTDSQIATHLVDADLVVSADRNFVRFAKRCKEEGPVAIADAALIAGGNQGIQSLLDLLSAR